MISEPMLSASDEAEWGLLKILSDRRTKTVSYARNVDKARRLIDTMATLCSLPAIMWSGGKDSTAMVRLSASVGIDASVISEKDDLDYPGELEYINETADKIGVRCVVITPESSPMEWVRSHSSEMDCSDDIHSRSARLSKEFFYGIVESETKGNDGIMLGLRAEESRARQVNRATHGPIYRRRDGKIVCCPLSDWEGIDVFAYLFSNGIEPLHVYKCISFMHRGEPWRIRKSWWLPGSNSRHGEISWLRHYYPSLYRRMLEWFPSAQSYT